MTTLLALIQQLLSAAARQRLRRREFEALNALDPRLLRDIGLDHSQLGPVGDELSGEAEVQRLRVLYAPAR